MSKPEPGEIRHELSDVHGRPVLVFGAVLSGLIVLALLGMWMMFRYYAAQETREGPPPSPLAGLRKPPPDPRLQTVSTLRQDLVEARAREEALLNRYDWVDRKSGVVRIPVERAIELLAQEPKKP